MLKKAFRSARARRSALHVGTVLTGAFLLLSAPLWCVHSFVNAEELPSQCLGRGSDCWSHLPERSLAIRFRFPPAMCGADASEIVALTADLVQAERSDEANTKAANASYPARYFLTTSALDAIEEADRHEIGVAYLRCQPVSPSAEKQSWLLYRAADSFAAAAFSARSAGDKEGFSDNFARAFTAAKSIIDRGAPAYVLEETYRTLHLACFYASPELGPSFPDYGRLMSWPEYHQSGCDTYN